MDRVFGCKPDVHDHRDFPYSACAPVDQSKPLPPKVDLRPLMSPVEDQKNVGSCVANASVGAMEYLQLQALKKRWMCFNKYRDLSRLYAYFNSRLLDGTIYEDAGTTLRSMMKGLSQYGVCSEAVWAYDVTKWSTRPTPAAYAEGKKHTVHEYYRVNSQRDLQNALANGLPVVFGAMLYSGFSETPSTGIVKMPDTAKESPLGGHAMLVVGYDLEAKQYIVRNSWGTGWADKGYCYIPFEFFGDLQSSCVWDAWVIKLWD